MLYMPEQMPPWDRVPGFKTDLLRWRPSIGLLIAIGLSVAIGLRCSIGTPLVLHGWCTIALLLRRSPAVVLHWRRLLVPSTAHALVEPSRWGPERCTSIPVVGRRVVGHLLGNLTRHSQKPLSAA